MQFLLFIISLQLLIPSVVEAAGPGAPPPPSKSCWNRLWIKLCCCCNSKFRKALDGAATSRSGDRKMIANLASMDLTHHPAASSGTMLALRQANRSWCLIWCRQNCCSKQPMASAPKYISDAPQGRRGSLHGRARQPFGSPHTHVPFGPLPAHPPYHLTGSPSMAAAVPEHMALAMPPVALAVTSTASSPSTVTELAIGPGAAAPLMNLPMPAMPGVVVALTMPPRSPSPRQMPALSPAAGGAPSRDRSESSSATPSDGSSSSSIGEQAGK